MEAIVVALRTTTGNIESSKCKRVVEESPVGGCERQRDSRGLFTASWHGEVSAQCRGREPGRCQRGGSNDDLYPLLPVLLPTRDNTNHYHRLITGITANIEIMRACVCDCICISVCARLHMCQCARANEHEQMYIHVCACTSRELVLGAADPFLPPRRRYRPLPYFFFTTHSRFFCLSFSSSLLSGRSVAAQYSTTLPASSAIRAAASALAKSGASQRRTKRSVRRR